MPDRRQTSNHRFKQALSQHYMAIPAVVNTVWLQLEIKALPVCQSKQVGMFFRVSSVRKDKDSKTIRKFQIKED